MRDHWQEFLIAYLHDPPDKALSIPGHEPRACRYLSAALRREVTRSELRGREDAHASAAERLPLPEAGPNGEWAVGPENGRLTVFHPLSGTPEDFKVPDLDETMVERAIGEIAEPHRDRPSCFYALWRLLPKRLAEREPEPAELSLAEAALAACPCPGRVLYARVDLLRHRRLPVVAELELIEPSLYLCFGEGAVDRLADAVAALLLARPRRGEPDTLVL